MSAGTSTWQALVAFARDHGWSADLTPAGRIKLSKAGSVVFAPGPAALTNETVAEAVERLGYVEGFMEHCRRNRP